MKALNNINDFLKRGRGWWEVNTMVRDTPGSSGLTGGSVDHHTRALYYTLRPLKSFEIRVGHSPSFGLPSVAILSHWAECDAIFTLYDQWSRNVQYCARSLTHSYNTWFMAYHILSWIYRSTFSSLKHSFQLRSPDNKLFWPSILLMSRQW